MSTPRQLPHTWALLERTTNPSVAALTEALLIDWAADPQAVHMELILAQLRVTTAADASTTGPNFADQLGHLVW